MSLPALSRAWEEIKSKSPSRFEELRKLESKDFEGDPRKWQKRRWRHFFNRAVQQVMRSGRIRLAELHWYEAHGIGRKEIKRKLYLD